MGDYPGIAAAIHAAITAESVREALLEAQANERDTRRWNYSYNLQEGIPALERAAQRLRQGIVAEFLKKAAEVCEGEKHDTLDDDRPTFRKTQEPLQVPEKPPLEETQNRPALSRPWRQLPTESDHTVEEKREPLAGESISLQKRPIGPFCVCVSFQDLSDDPLPTRHSDLQVEGMAPQGAQSATIARLTCPQCRRPLELGVRLEPLDSQLRAFPPLCRHRQEERRACCAVLCNSGKLDFLQALVLGQSLVASGSDTDHVLLHSPTVPANYLEVLSQVWSLRPLKAWPRRLFLPSAKVARMRALELIDYDKVLLLEIGLLICGNVDVLFDLECPAACFAASGRGGIGLSTVQGAGDSTARETPWTHTDRAVQSKSGRRLDLSMVLLRPSRAALKRMAFEIGVDSAAWPPRGSDSGASQNWVEEYVTRFYTAFFSGTWTEIPPEFAPKRIVDDSSFNASHRGGGGCFAYHLQGRAQWEEIEHQIRAPGRREAQHHLKVLSASDLQERSGSDVLQEAPCAMACALLRVAETERRKRLAAAAAGADGAAAPSVLVSGSQAAFSLHDVIGKVDRRRCAVCRNHDSGGFEDPIPPKRWLCRFCWEELLLQASLQQQCQGRVPLPIKEVKQLKQALGTFYLGPGPQRWSWEIGHAKGWIEFRPKGALWIREDSTRVMGAWEILGGEPGRRDDREPQLRLHIFRSDRYEVRHVMQLWKEDAACIKLEELRREVFRSPHSVMFCKPSSADTTQVRCWAVPLAHPSETAPDAKEVVSTHQSTKDISAKNKLSYVLSPEEAAKAAPPRASATLHEVAADTCQQPLEGITHKTPP